jgi:IS605 OrfB family transposase
LGIRNLVATSTNKLFKSPKVKQIKRKFRHLRSVLQAKGTRSSRRLLKAISGRETRFMAWVNHNISKNIVFECDAGDKIVMENLKGIRKQRRGKRINYWINSWSFAKLQSFIQYKAERRGVLTEKVNPAYTSQICHRCGHLGVRTRGEFSCQSCGLFHFNSDLNASRNLAHPKLVGRQAAVTQPHSPNDDTKASIDEQRLSSGLKAANFS